jgi:hypothetical protein
MLSKEARKERNEKFWSGFKEYMRGTLSTTGKRVNWLNYKTEVQDTYLRLICDGKTTAVCYDIQFKDAGIKAIFWEQLGELKKVLEASMEQTTTWNEEFTTKEGLVIGRIYWELENANFYNDDDWEKIYSFFKKRLIEFDAFYQEFKDILIALVD